MKSYNQDRMGRMIVFANGYSNTRKKLFFLVVFVVAVYFIIPMADSQCCSIGNWEATARAFLDSDDIPGVPIMSSNSQRGSTVLNAPALENRRDSFPNGKMLLPLKSVASSDAVIDVSIGNDFNGTHIQNAIHLPVNRFLNANGSLKPYDELAKILGDAGISERDPVIIYGSSESSGESEFAFWILSYLGHKDARVLDGNLQDWIAAGLPTESSENRKPAVSYEPDIKPEFLAEYDYIKSGQAQILDARPFSELSKGRIPGALAIDVENVRDKGMIKNGESLKIIFERFNKVNPVVVYSDDYVNSPLVWFALRLMGYNASIYTWSDWRTHEIKNSSILAEPIKEAIKSSNYYKKLGRT